MTNFIDSGQILGNFMNIVYVHCPNCRKCAAVMDNVSNRAEIFADRPNPSFSKKQQLDHLGNGIVHHRHSSDSRKLSCLHCAYTKVWQRSMGVVDFRQSLWLQTSCCGEMLWALNKEHLDFIAQYVEAKLRPKFSRTGTYRNKTLASRLPLWMKSAKNRDEVLKGVRRLYKLAESI